MLSDYYTERFQSRKRGYLEYDLSPNVKPFVIQPPKSDVSRLEKRQKNELSSTSSVEVQDLSNTTEISSAFARFAHIIDDTSDCSQLSLETSTKVNAMTTDTLLNNTSTHIDLRQQSSSPSPPQENSPPNQEQQQEPQQEKGKEALWSPSPVSQTYRAPQHLIHQNEGDQQPHLSHNANTVHHTLSLVSNTVRVADSSSQSSVVTPSPSPQDSIHSNTSGDLEVTDNFNRPDTGDTASVRMPDSSSPSNLVTSSQSSPSSPSSQNSVHSNISGNIEVTDSINRSDTDAATSVPMSGTSSQNDIVMSSQSLENSVQSNISSDLEVTDNISRSDIDDGASIQSPDSSSQNNVTTSSPSLENSIHSNVSSVLEVTDSISRSDIDATASVRNDDRSDEGVDESASEESEPDKRDDQKNVEDGSNTIIGQGKMIGMNEAYTPGNNTDEQNATEVYDAESSGNDYERLFDEEHDNMDICNGGEYNEGDEGQSSCRENDEMDTIDRAKLRYEQMAFEKELSDEILEFFDMNGLPESLEKIDLAAMAENLTNAHLKRIEEAGSLPDGKYGEDEIFAAASSINRAVRDYVRENRDPECQHLVEVFGFRVTRQLENIRREYQTLKNLEHMQRKGNMEQRKMRDSLLQIQKEHDTLERDVKIRQEALEARMKKEKTLYVYDSYLQELGNAVIEYKG